MRGDKFREARRQKIKELNFSPRRERLHEIIFEADTKLGKWFDEALLVMIIMSVVVVMLETVQSYDDQYHQLFVFLEWVFTIFFTIEYITRLYVVYNPKKYALSFYGIVDLLSILPTYISLFLVGAQSLLVIRALRLLRVFRIFKLGNYLKQGRVLGDALKTSKDKIIVFLFAVLIMVCIFGSIMYLVEHNGNDQFDNIPRSVYWAIVTLTTVGYGDISPNTPLGQFIAAIVMVMGYAVIAVPTGIVGSELMKADKNEEVSTQACKFCMEESHVVSAIYCHQCGKLLNEHSPSAHQDE